MEHTTHRNRYVYRIVMNGIEVSKGKSMVIITSKINYRLNNFNIHSNSKLEDFIVETDK